MVLRVAHTGSNSFSHDEDRDLYYRRNNYLESLLDDNDIEYVVMEEF